MSGTVDVRALLASDWPSPCYRGALMVLATMHKPIPGIPSGDPDDPEPFYVDWQALELAAGPWSSSERQRVELARLIAEGVIADATYTLDAVNWRVLLEALAVARGGPATA